MTDWTTDAVAKRFAEAAETARRLPRVQAQGYAAYWPAFAYVAYQDKAPANRPLPPSPQAIERMLETMRWVQWLEVEQRRLVWLRARGFEWCDIGRRLGCERTTAWRRWQKAIATVASRLAAGAAQERK